ncbi:hypothetical protein [Streptomyces sp. NPDC002491]
MRFSVLRTALFGVVGRFRMGLWALAVAAYLVMAEISRLLSALTVTDKPAYSAGVLSGWPGFNPIVHDQPGDAVAVWAIAAGNLKVGDGRALVLGWIRTDLVLDFVVFTPAYVIALYLLLSKIWDVLGNDAPFQPERIKWFVLAVLLFDWGETVFSLVLVGDLSVTPQPVPSSDVLAGARPSDVWVDTVACLSFAKWVALTVTVLFGVMGFARTLPVTLMPWLGRWRRGSLSDRRVWTRHRNQLGVLLILALLVVVSGGGPLEQLPDITRAWAGHGSGYRLMGDILGPALALIGLCLALWVAGRWALLDGVRETRYQERTLTLAGLAVLGGLLCGVALLFHLGGDATWGALAFPALLLLGAGWSLFLPEKWKNPATEKTAIPPLDVRERIRTAGRALTVVPCVIAGLGLTRAYARPLLLGPQIGAGADLHLYRQVVIWFTFGVVAAVFAGPLVNGLLRWAESRWIDRSEKPEGASPESEESEGASPESDEAEDSLSDSDVSEQSPPRFWQDGRRWVPTAVGAVLLLAAVGMGIGLAVEPIVWGPRLRSLGILALFLATGVLIAGAFARYAEYHLPLPVLRYLHFRLTPLWLIVVGVLVLEAKLDADSNYHDVRLKPRQGSASAPAQPFDAQTYFDRWLAATNRCMDGDAELKKANAAPMVFVAAPGGGIRAAYWTGSAMDEVTKSPCARDMVFSASGVSGGSLGLVGDALGPKPGSSPSDSGREFAARLSGEDTLAADMAALFYRDLPRALHGIDSLGDMHPGDRATVFERSWERIDPRLKGEFFQTSHGSDDPTSWRPLLLLNGTDVGSGCRVVVSSVWAVGGPKDDAAPALSCRRAVVAERPGVGDGGGDAAGFAAGALDAAAYTDAPDCKEEDRNEGLRLSTAVHLAARFPYISPSGQMHRCVTGSEPQSLTDLDGGLLEASGLSVLLELWQELEPQVAAHNKAVAVDGGGRFVLPLIAVLDNHYQSLGAAPRIQRQMELVAPLVANGAPKAALSATTLGQVALYRFSGALPGTTIAPKVLVDGRDCSQARSFFVAPSNRPGIAAPLGWVLSPMSRNDLTTQLRELAQTHDECKTSKAPGRTPGTFSTLLKLLRGPVTVQAR